MEDAPREDLITEVLNRLDNIGNAIADGAEVGFEILVRQAIIDGSLKLLSAMAFFVIFLIMIKMSHKMYRDDFGIGESSYSDFGHKDWGTLILIVSIAPLLLSGFFFSDGIKKVLNPGYYAIREVLRTFGA